MEILILVHTFSWTVQTNIMSATNFTTFILTYTFTCASWQKYVNNGINNFYCTGLYIKKEKKHMQPSNLLYFHNV